MTRLRTLAAVALLAIAMGSCGNSPSAPSPRETAVLRLSFPDPVVAAPSNDPRFAMEATVPMVITETSGKGGAWISYFGVGIDDAATGLAASPLPVVTFAEPRFLIGVQPPAPVFLGAGAKVDASFRVSLPRTGTFRVLVTVTAWTAIPNTQYNDLTNYSGEFRIVPPQ